MVDYTQDNTQDEPMSAEEMEKEQEKSKLSSYIYRKFEKILDLNNDFVVGVSGGPDSLALCFLTKLY